MLKLPHGLSFPDLYTRDGLMRVDAAFLAALVVADVALCSQLRAAREQADVHRSGVLAQAVGEELKPVFPVDGDVVVADFRDDFLSLLIGKHHFRVEALFSAALLPRKSA